MEVKVKRNIFHAILIIPIIFLLAILSCKDSITNPAASQGAKDFPNKVGSQWKYFFYDSLSSAADTVIVRIVGDTTFAGNRTAKIWEFNFKERTEYRFVEILNDTVRIFPFLQYLWQNTKFIFPLEVNNGWKGDFANDTNSVIKYDSISVAAGHFTDCFLIQETWSGYNDFGRVLTWFVPGTGIVKKHYLGGDFGAANEYWELLEYSN